MKNFMKRLLIILSVLLISSCAPISKSEDKNSESDYLSNFRITSSVGDTFYYRRDMLNVFEQGDTISGLAQWTISKDTLIEGKTWHIYDGIEYCESSGQIDTVLVRILAHQNENGLEVAQVSDVGIESQFDVLRGSRDREISRTMTFEEIRYTLYNRKLPISRSSDDYSDYQDYTYELAYPLTNGEKWNNRADDTPWKHHIVEKQCLGVDSILLDGIKTPTVKVEVLSGEAFDIDDIFFYQWYDSNGIVKSYLDFGEFVKHNEDGTISTTLHSYDYYIRISKSEMNVDELRPY